MPNPASWLQQAGRLYPSSPAVARGRTVVAHYAEQAERVAALAGALRAGGLERGDRVALYMRNTPAYLEALFTAWHAGLVAVPINAKLAADEVAYILRHSGSRWCFVTRERAAMIAGLQSELPELAHVIDTDGGDYQRLLAAAPVDVADGGPDDPAWLFYTSGTTGAPKGAVLTQRNLVAMSAAYFMDVDTIDVGDAILHAAPLSHGSGLYALPHVAAGALHILPETGGFDVDEVCTLLAAHERVAFFAAPTMVKRLTRHVREQELETPGLRTIVYGGGPMYLADLKEALDVFGYRLVEIYGQGETPMTITAKSKTLHARCHNATDEALLTAVGRPHGVVDVRVIDDQGRERPAGEVGEIIVRGDTVMSGYWQQPEATAKTLVGGWLYTGDRGCFDAHGLLYLKDRSKDVIISGGTNIYTREVEDALLIHPGVFEVAVVGQPDAEWGEVVVAFVVATADAGVDAAALDRHCLERIARFKRPKAYYFVDELPKNAYGKIVKNCLREQLPGGR